MQALVRHSFTGREQMPRKSNVSAGLLLYRRRDGVLQFFLAHPGGPFWRAREEGAWTIPKGVVEEGEAPFAAAKREFHEETGFQPEGPFRELGSIRQKAGKVVHAWAVEGDADPDAIQSNVVRVEWPRGTGRWVSYPEVDRCGWFDAEQAKRLVNPAQADLIDRLEKALGVDGNSR
jgi:predicted NUDIX family NTP pyrophosphohydrolase